MEGVATQSINYTDNFELGIEAKAQRRLFFPATGDAYTSNGTNIIRINLSADAMLDTSNSYLKFNLQNKTGAGLDKKVAFDLGQPVISRLVISSGGVVLEDIQHYNHLVGGILAPAGYGSGNKNADYMNRQFFTQAGGAVDFGNKLFTSNIAAAGDAANGVCVFDGNESRVVCYKLYSAILDNPKMIPLVLINAGIDIEIHLADGNVAGCCEDNNDVVYSVSNVRYVAHLVNLQRDFYDMLRMTMSQSGGRLQLHGQTYRTFTGSIANGIGGEQTINIPVRARSIKSVFFKASGDATNENFILSTGSHMNLTGYQLLVGAVRYPPTAVAVDSNTNKIEPYLELEKSFGKLGSNIHNNLLSLPNYLSGATGSVAKNSNVEFAPFGFDLESIGSNVENGLDTSSRGLQSSLILQLGANAPAALTVFIYTMLDSLFLVGMDGSMAVSS
tara:strand:+ start:596 stop:1930 length:1335 start_codon:yes stop_codon:yes gene_type:complete